MFSGQLSKAIRMMAVALAVSGCASAQYGGGGGGASGTYSSGSRSYGNGAKIGAAVGGAAGAGLLFYALHRRHTQVVGCVAPDGKSLTADNGKKTYQLDGEAVPSGQRVAVVGKRMKDSSGMDELQVRSIKKNMGKCEQSTAMATKP